MYGSFKAHRAELTGGPGDGVAGAAKASAGHRHGTQAIAFAQCDGQDGDAQFGGGDKHARYVAHLGLGLLVRAHHEARRVYQRDDRQAVDIAQVHEACRFVARRGIDSATQVKRVVGHDAHRLAFDAGKRGMDAVAKAGAEHQHGTGVGNTFNHLPAVVHAQAVLWHHMAHGQRVGRRPIAHPALEHREVMFGRLHRLGFVLHQNVDHAIAVLHWGRAHFFGLENAQPAAFDHGRAGHADVGALVGNDHVAHAQKSCVARKAAARHNAQQRYLAAQLGQGGKRGLVQAGDKRKIHIARAAATAFGKQNKGQLVALRTLHQAVGLDVAALALGARQHGGVIGHHGAERFFVTELGAVDIGHAGDDAVCRRVGDQVVFAAAAGLGGNHQRTVFDKRVCIAQIGQVFAGGALAA